MFANLWIVCWRSPSAFQCIAFPRIPIDAEDMTAICDHSLRCQRLSTSQRVAAQIMLHPWGFPLCWRRGFLSCKTRLASKTMQFPPVSFDHNFHVFGSKRKAPKTATPQPPLVLRSKRFSFFCSESYAITQPGQHKLHSTSTCSRLYHPCTPSHRPRLGNVVPKIHWSSRRAPALQAIKMGTQVQNSVIVLGRRVLRHGNRCLCASWQGTISPFNCALILDCACVDTLCRGHRRVPWVMACSYRPPDNRLLPAFIRTWNDCCVNAHHKKQVSDVTIFSLTGIVWSLPIAFILVCVGSIAGESLLFLSFRNFLHDRIVEFRKKHEHSYGTMVMVITHHKRWMVFLIRLSAIPVWILPRLESLIM